MEKDRENLWSRRSNKLSLSMNNASTDERRNDHNSSSRSYNTPKRYGDGGRGGGDSSSHGRSNPFNAITPLATATVQSPTAAGASTAFGLGSGAFASFGSAAKTPKTPGTAFDWGKASAATGNAPPTTPGEKRRGDGGKATFSRSASQQLLDGKEEMGRGDESAFIVERERERQQQQQQQQQQQAVPPTPIARDPTTSWPLKHAWVIWYRPPTSKTADYEKSIKPVCRMETAQQFWRVYSHLKRPSGLPTVSDYHFFREGIRPVWEDDANKMGGKWIMRLKKGVADRYWEDLLLTMIGDQFMEAADEVCGAVLSVRSGEDVMSIWTKKDGGRNIKIRETVKRILALPGDTNIQWKSHDDSIAQRSAIDQARLEKSGGYNNTVEKRRATMSSNNNNMDDGGPPATTPGKGGRDRITSGS